MAYLIGSKCINCDMCVPECPNQAISMGRKIYEINPEKCTECQGFYDEPTCVQVCPIHCIKPDPDHQESKESLLIKFQKLHTG